MFKVLFLSLFLLVGCGGSGGSGNTGASNNAPDEEVIVEEFNLYSYYNMALLNSQGNSLPLEIDVDLNDPYMQVNTDVFWDSTRCYATQRLEKTGTNTYKLYLTDLFQLNIAQKCYYLEGSFTITLTGDTEASIVKNP